MKDEILLKISLLISIIGIILLFVFAQGLEAEKIEIGEIGKSSIGKYIEVFAIVSSFSESNGNYFLKIGDKTGNITAVLFKNDADNINTARFKKGIQIRIIGKINEYRGNIEIITDKIDFIWFTSIFD